MKKLKIEITTKLDDIELINRFVQYLHWAAAKKDPDCVVVLKGVEDEK